MNLKTNYADKSNYGKSRSLSSIKYIVVHYTANDGDTDESNAKYFHSRKNLGASAHYFVDDDSVTISVPDNYIAWSVGGKRYSNYKSTGGAEFYGVCTNANSISIEMCDTKRDGKYAASEQTLANTKELIQELMNKYNIPESNVIRHFDVTGKCCPAYFASKGNIGWSNFISGLKNKSFIYNGVDYSPVFNASVYAALNPDVKKTYGANASKLFEHFCKYGMTEGRQGSTMFNVYRYKEAYADLQTAFQNNLPMYYMHYCTCGMKEGRSGL